MVESQIQKNLFKKWLKKNRNISESTFTSYTEGVLDKIHEVIRLSNNALLKNLNPDLYSYDTLDKYDKFFNILKNDPNFDIVNKTGQAQSGWLSTPLNHYRRFLEAQPQGNNSTEKLIDYIKQYKVFKSSDEYDEEYKWDYAKKHQGDFNNLDNFENKINSLENYNIRPYFLQRTGLNHLMQPYNIEIFKNSLKILFDENKDLEIRIKEFLNDLHYLLKNDVHWNNKNMLPDEVDASYFLFTNNFEKYLLFNQKTSFNSFAKHFGLSDLLDKSDKVKRYIRFQEYCQNQLIPIMNDTLGYQNTLLDAQDFIRFVDKYILKNSNNNEDNKESIKTLQYKETHMNENINPLNQILYGPPGTGKTYKMREYIENILSSNPGLNINSEEQKLNDIVKDLSWYTAIAISMYLNGKQNKYKVSDLMQQKIIKAFALTRENKNLRAALWAQMQIHTSEDCKTVNYTNRQTPFIFEKNKNSEWYLTDDGIKFVEENLADQVEQYKAPNNTRKIEDFYKFITFHQSYSYEEFVEGIKPNINAEEDNSQISYEYNKGIFKEICQQANSDPDNKYLLIIDEINRGNISKIFGELITLIETNKRVRPNKERNFENTKVEKEQLLVTLPYTKSKFGVPNNLYIIGTMNTSDRSIASIDIALRRRFKFVEMMPKPELVADFGCGFQSVFDKLNTKIKILLDRDHQIGHSYFINTKYANADTNILKEIWFSEIIPLLNEYFYCDWEKLKLVIPGFIKEITIPEELKNDCEDSMYEFKTPNEVKDFVGALKQDKFKQED